VVRSCDVLRATGAFLFFSIGSVLASLAHLLANAFPPRVENPLPESIGLDAPFVSAGMGGVLLGILFSPARQATRERAMRWGALVGFVLGAGLYAFALLAQVGWWR